MEKRTMGKFIAVLRKANGMTQQELGDKLMVSDNTVSKWERDERMPDISLLPAIAEIFGITTDELLRGERNNPERENYGTEETEAKQKAKSDKQLKNMLNKKMRIYNSLTCVSVAIIFFSLILGFLIVGFLLPAELTLIGFGLLLVAVACQLVFANNALIRPDEDEQHLHSIGKFNLRVVDTAAWVIIITLSIFLFSALFLFDFYRDGSAAGSYGAITLVFAEISYLVYIFVVRKAFEKCGFIVYAEEKKQTIKRNTNLLKKMAIICGAGAIVFVSIGHGIFASSIYVNKHYQKFDDLQEFKAYMEGMHDAMCEDEKVYFWQTDESGETVFLQEEYETYCENLKKQMQIVDPNGKVLCEYYCREGEEYRTTFDYDKDGNIEILYLSHEDNYRAWEEREQARITFYIVAATYLGVCAIVYITLAMVNKKKVLAGADVNDADDNKAEDVRVEQVKE